MEEIREEIQETEVEDERTEYVTFNVKAKDGTEMEMAVVDEFDFEKDHYVVAAEVKGDVIDEEGLYIYRAIIKGDDFTVEEIRKAFDYRRIAEAYMNMENE